MSVKTIHLNLLQDSERLSSSPIRARVMVPLATGVILTVLLLWYGYAYLQLRMVTTELASIRSELANNKKIYDEVLELKADLGKKEAELGQLRGFMNSRHAWGESLAAVAGVIPEGLQLTMIEIPAPPEQKLAPPPGVKKPPLLGPTNELEAVTFRIVGKAEREERLFEFLDAVKTTEVFSNNLVFVEGKGVPDADLSPRMLRFGQDALIGEDGKRAIVFDVEYRTPGRNFAP